MGPGNTWSLPPCLRAGLPALEAEGEDGGQACHRGAGVCWRGVAVELDTFPPRAGGQHRTSHSMLMQPIVILMTDT